MSVPQPFVAHYRDTNMHENTEIRREARNISCHAMVPDKPRYRVVAAGKGLFHITESPSGKVRGFRQRYKDACELARWLER
ncbi:hypothetical protein HU735_19890 [Pseudomonas sp. BW16M2]|uniref:hypothetical protein n=1 Tax=Pseudomonas sp. BW16M2 TaxID=2745489 RepID=UPI0016454F20|nr:hypothetical protein [Pseudomonas sp. BW16M2]MBC3437686.1 hypothetical protein [Pseudomonas sp. BW16M2]